MLYLQNIRRVRVKERVKERVRLKERVRVKEKVKKERVNNYKICI